MANFIKNKNITFSKKRKQEKQSIAPGQYVFYKEADEGDHQELLRVKHISLVWLETPVGGLVEASNDELTFVDSDDEDIQDKIEAFERDERFAQAENKMKEAKREYETAVWNFERLGGKIEKQTKK